MITIFIMVTHENAVTPPLLFSNTDSREGRGEVDAVAPVIRLENGSHRGEGKLMKGQM